MEPTTYTPHNRSIIDLQFRIKSEDKVEEAMLNSTNGSVLLKKIEEARIIREENEKKRMLEEEERKKKEEVRKKEEFEMKLKQMEENLSNKYIYYKINGYRNNLLKEEVNDLNYDPHKFIINLLVKDIKGEEITCNVCLENRCSIVYYECGHFNCKSCYLTIKNNMKNLCPLCRKKISVNREVEETSDFRLRFYNTKNTNKYVSEGLLLRRVKINKENPLTNVEQLINIIYNDNYLYRYIINTYLFLFELFTHDYNQIFIMVRNNLMYATRDVKNTIFMNKNYCKSNGQIRDNIRRVNTIYECLRNRRLDSIRCEDRSGKRLVMINTHDFLKKNGGMNFDIFVQLFYFLVNNMCITLYQYSDDEEHLYFRLNKCYNKWQQ